MRRCRSWPGFATSWSRTLTSETAKFQKKIKTDHTLALELWKTGNAEARILALQVADAAKVTAADAGKILTTIEKEIHRSANWARRAMTSALIAIGVYKPALRKKVIEAAKRIGKVEVDHGETSCKTPDAIAYIEKMLQRRIRSSFLKMLSPRYSSGVARTVRHRTRKHADVRRTFCGG